MWGVAAAAGGATSSPSVTEPARDAGGARNSTRRENIDARWRGAVSGRATGADTPWLSAPTARAPTLRRPRSARGIRRPAVRQRGGGLPPPGGGSMPRQRSQKTHRPPPIESLRAKWRWRMIGTSPALMALSHRRCFLSLEKLIGSVFDASKRTRCRTPKANCRGTIPGSWRSQL